MTTAAASAPSILDAAPWRFVFGDDLLEVWAEPDGLSDKLDPHGRFMAISCGAATYNACLAIRSAGHESWIQVHPRPGEWLLTAAVHIGVRRLVAPEDLARYDVIGTRLADPGPYRDWRLPFSLITRLEEAAEAEGGLFRVLTSTEVERVRDSVLDIERSGPAAASDPVFASLTGAQADAPTPHIPGQHGGPDRHRSARDDAGLSDLDSTEHIPTLAVLSTPGNSTKDWVRAGMALERVLLTALLHGVVASFVDAPVDELTERAHLRAAGFDHPQLLLRLGYPRTGAIRAQDASDQVASTGGPGR